MHRLILGLLLALPATAAPPAPTVPLEVAAAPTVHTGGQPSAADLAALAAQGVRAVIDLRGVDEPRGMDEAALVQSLGMRYHALPVEGPGGVSVDRARELSALVDAAQGPVLVHCASGNRVGALLALEAFHVDGASAEQALRVGQAAGLASLRPTVEGLLVR